VAIFSKQNVSEATPLTGVEALFADLDGVVYTGPRSIPHAVECLNQVAAEMRVGYITNNASRTDESVAAHLRELGLSCTASDIVTSPQAAMGILREVAPAGSTILVIGGEGLISEVTKAGFVVTDSAHDNPAAVIQGFSPDIGWTHLAEASFALNARSDAHPDGIPWIATNMDWTIPVERGTAPGNGTLVSAVHLAAGRMPVVAGKPETAIFDEARQRFDVTRALYVGDRLDTDILGANRAQMRSALVLTGIDGPKQVLAAPEGQRPEFILGDLRELLMPYPETVVSKKGAVTVGTATVSLDTNDVDIVVDDAGDGLDLLRATCQLIWRSGRAIYGFTVPEKTYAPIR
jgi:HAD superfamily hydrolase (TIGR01450 family)